MLQVKHLILQIIMAVDYCGRHPARRLRSAARAYLKKQGATPHPGAHKHTLQYDWKPDQCFLVLFGTWSIGSLSRKNLGRAVIDNGCCVVFLRNKMEKTWFRSFGEEGK